MFSTILTVLGGLVLVLGLASKKLENSPFAPTLLALIAGILLGPHVTGIIDLADLGERSTILENASRVTLGIGLISVALRVRKEYLRQNWHRAFAFTGCAMLAMWLISATLVHLFLGLPLWTAALIGAIVAATDPIAATPIVTGQLAEKHIPEKVRDTVSFESGANDGLAYLFVFIAIAMMTKPAGDALWHWFTHTLLWEVVVATAFGAVLGALAAVLLQFSERRGWIGEDWRLVYTVALGLIAIGAGKLIHSDEVLVVFAAGVAFTQIVTAEDRGEEERGQEAVNRFFSIPIFALIGLAIPWKDWAELGWKGVALAVAILLLRRPPVLLLLKRLAPGLQGTMDALFVGWFGPISVAAVYYAALTETHVTETIVWPVVSLIVCASTVAHSLTAAPFTRHYGKSRS